MCIVWSYDDVYGYQMYRLIYHMTLFWFDLVIVFLFESHLTLTLYTLICILINVPYLGWLCWSCMILQICLSTSQELKGQKVNDLPVRKSWVIPQCTFSPFSFTTSNSMWLILKVGPKKPLVSYSYVGDASEGHLFFSSGTPCRGRNYWWGEVSTNSNRTTTFWAPNQRLKPRDFHRWKWINLDFRS